MFFKAISSSKHNFIIVRITGSCCIYQLVQTSKYYKISVFVSFLHQNLATTHWLNEKIKKTVSLTYFVE
jgi:hypothetical protein